MEKTLEDLRWKPIARAEKAMEVLDNISEAVKVDDKETLKKVAITSIYAGFSIKSSPPFVA